MATKEEYALAMEKATLLDDVFMSVVFDNELELTEFVLKIILNRTLKVKSVKTQYSLKNLRGRDIRLDIYAESEDGKEINIEIQRQDKGASAKRARYNSSLLDANSLSKGSDFDALPETYIIFITERDVLKLNEPIYFIERMIVGKNVFFNDAAHIVYVNNSIKDDTPLGKLMHDFACNDPNKMFYEEVSEKVRAQKEKIKEESTMPGFMSEIEERIRRETTEKVRRETLTENARKMIARGKLTFEEIAEDLSLPLEEVKALAAKNPV